MQLEDHIASLPGNAAVEALYTLAAKELKLEVPQDAYERLRNSLLPEDYERAMSVIRDLADSREAVDTFSRYVLAAAAGGEDFRSEVIESVDGAGRRAFLEGADILTDALTFGLLFLASAKITYASEKKADGSRKVRFTLEPRAKFRDLMKLFGIETND